MKRFIYTLCLLITLLLIIGAIKYRDFTSDKAECVTEQIENNQAIVEKVGHGKQIFEEHQPVVFSIAEGMNFVETSDVNGKEKGPFVLPVATEDEMVKLNLMALEYINTEKEKIEPFYGLYDYTELKTVGFEGTVRAVSTIPVPDKNDYDNCLYTLFVELDSVFFDTSSSIPNELIIVVPIMKDKHIIENNIYQLGDKIWCIGADYDSMPEEVLEIQLSDNIQSFEHQQYYILKSKKITTFSGKGSKNFAKKEKYILPIQSLPKDEKAAEQRKERIKKEISRIEAELEKHGGTFEAWKNEYETVENKYKKLCNENWKGWINDSYYSTVGNNHSAYDTEAYINAMLPYKEYLERNNIDLIVVRIPAKGDFASSVLGSDVFQENPLWIEHYYKCLKADIEIVDPMPFMWEHRFDLPLFYYYNTPADSHPFEGTFFYASQILANVLSRYQYQPSTDEFRLERVSHTGKDSKFFYPWGNSQYPPQENITYNHVIYHNKPMSNLQRMSGAPFLFVSNSYFGYYLTADLGLPYYTAYWLKTVPDWVYQDGDTKLLRNVVDMPELLASRKAIILVGMPGMWGTVPIPSLPKYLLDGAQKICFEKKLDMSSYSVEIVDNEQHLVAKTSDGLEFKRRVDDSVSFMLTIPHVQNKSSCMIRFKYFKNSSSNVFLIDPNDDSIIDFDFFKGGDNVMYDLFVPLKEDDRLVKVKIDPLYTSPFVLEDIEFWYY